MRKIGLMGGTFDPIHIGHLVAAERSMEACGLEQVWFIPNAGPPLKERAPGASPEERLRMAELATEDHPAFRVLDLELRRGGISYTYDTVDELSRLEPDAEFHLIVGTDRIRDLPLWHRIDELAQRIRFIGVDRPDDGKPADPALMPPLPEPLRERVIRVPMPQLDISSTAIRTRLAAGLSARYLVPDAVLGYLTAKGLYRHDG
ncbi:nicotinate (nicotinamide) nucleotide adenylyltransferase [Paenibacillus albicereus]|uniref:Probable nicotinate-nucleotide adenylyltransferase n=1 Tax=Paenibacillus albicereus TaxID=2726185 RepID=A0A6H2GYZ0_9BACL|nr:nicotinate-nucleotide adenylyltransferase [Paenibacillus albicereus]QJC52653.1 nicotinate (nicotinamide) nucleotide adenylyltransferase [Paenibacillus albicereus]